MSVKFLQSQAHRYVSHMFGKINRFTIFAMFLLFCYYICTTQNIMFRAPYTILVFHKFSPLPFFVL